MRTSRTDKQHDAKPRIIRCCHMCSNIMEFDKEPTKCLKCKKPFLPHNYFAKIHDHNNQDFESLYVSACSLTEEELIKGIEVIW